MVSAHIKSSGTPLVAPPFISAVRSGVDAVFHEDSIGGDAANFVPRAVGL
jgi:hypothetical protein